MSKDSQDSPIPVENAVQAKGSLASSGSTSSAQWEPSSAGLIPRPQPHPYAFPARTTFNVRIALPAEWLSLSPYTYRPLYWLLSLIQFIWEDLSKAYSASNWAPLAYLAFFMETFGNALFGIRTGDKIIGHYFGVAIGAIEMITAAGLLICDETINVFGVDLLRIGFIGVAYSGTFLLGFGDDDAALYLTLGLATEAIWAYCAISCNRPAAGAISIVTMVEQTCLIIAGLRYAGSPDHTALDFFAGCVGFVTAFLAAGALIALHENIMKA